MALIASCKQPSLTICVLAAGLDDTVCSDAIVDLVLNTNGTSVSASGYNILNRTVAGGLTPVAQVTVPTNGVAANYLRNEVYRNTFILRNFLLLNINT